MAVGSDSISKVPEQTGKIGGSDGNKEESPRRQFESDGKTCHQCRQKTWGFVSVCKNQKKDKPCTIKFCHKCLMNRYGEKAEEMAVLEDWCCPKCRGICNCSCCRKKQGHLPTGILVHKARATGFSSVSELLHVKGPENFGIAKIVEGMDIGPTKAAASKNRKREKENSLSETSISDLHPLHSPSNLDEKEQKQMKQEGLKEIQNSKRRKNNTNATKFQNKDIYASITLPQGTELTTVAGIDLPPEDVGNALQFLEFCAAFGEILDMKDGEPEYVLEELKRGGRACRGRHSPVVWFHIQLLSLVQKDLGEKDPVITPKDGKSSWLHALHNCVSRSPYILNKLKLERFGNESDDYDSLDFSEKLRLLNLLCDEFLCTAKIRSWIDDQSFKFSEKVKEANERVVAAKKKEKLLKQKMQDEVAEAIIAKNGAPLSISEHEAIISQFKTEAAQAHAEILESKETITKEKQRPNALRTEPILLDANGHTYWRLKGYSDESNLLLQDVGSGDGDMVGLSEKWFTYNVEQEKEIEKYIYSLRKRRLRSQKKLPTVFQIESSEANLIL